MTRSCTGAIQLPEVPLRPTRSAMAISTSSPGAVSRLPVRKVGSDVDAVTMRRSTNTGRRFSWNLPIAIGIAIRATRAQNIASGSLESEAIADCNVRCGQYGWAMIRMGGGDYQEWGVEGNES